MASLVKVFVDFASNTVLSLFSGGVSLVAVTGLCYGISFLVYKHMKYFYSEEIAEKVEDDTIDEPVICSEKSTEFFSSYETDDLPNENETSHSVTRNESGKVKKFKNLQEYLKITVATHNQESRLERDGKIREFLEHLVKSLISENLDDVPLTPLSNDVQYETFFSEFHTKLSTKLTALSTSLHSNKDSESLDEAVRPSTLYNELKSVIRDIQEKAALLPQLQDYDIDLGPASIETRLEGQNYEEILSTAVLNKIISKSQNFEQSFTSENGIISGLIIDAEYKRSTHSWSSSPKEEFSLTVEQHIEETTTEYQLSEDEPESLIECSTKANLIERHRAHFPELGKDIVDVGYNSYEEDNATEIVSNIDSWEDNWLFQRKKKSKIKSTISQVSVPMLVPNPSEKYRALIGDVDVDETSDLSECSDSIVEELNEFIPTDTISTPRTSYIYKYDFKSNLEIPTLKNLLGDNELENFNLDHDQDSSGVTSISRDISDAYSFSSLSPSRSDEESLPWTGIKEAKNENIFFVQEDSGEGSLDTQAENEYLNNGEINHAASEDQITCEAFNFNSSAKVDGNDDTCDSSLDQDLATPPKPGTIAEREHLKWEQATPMPNNPYSKESIEKRNLAHFLPKSSVNSALSSYENGEKGYAFVGTDSDISKYGRDYYVNVENKTKIEETNHAEVKGNDVEYPEKPSENGFSKTVPCDNDVVRKPQSNLVRVSSWSERKHPDVKIKQRLPSVKELAKQFSGQTNLGEVKKTPVSKNPAVHSLTARSMSREFREGLKNNIGKTFNRNVLPSTADEAEKSEETNSSDRIKNGCHSLGNGVVIWENKI